MKRKKVLSGWLLITALFFSACADNNSSRLPQEPDMSVSAEEETANEDDNACWYENIPPYAGNPNVLVNSGIPFFSDGDLSTDTFEKYSELDEKGRCGAAFVNVCQEIMPTQERESIGDIRPTGWHTVKYDVIADRYLYNRCHLIGYQLSGENADERNLITGTRYMNVEGMLPWENIVAGYVEKSGNHVLYRVTPCFEGDHLVASGVLIEALSVEDGGEGICFNVYCYNVQPGIIIDYATGESSLDEAWSAAEEQPDHECDYVLNKSTRKFHNPSCDSVQDMSDKNKEYFSGDRETVVESGYIPCNRCNP